MEKIYKVIAIPYDSDCDDTDEYPNKVVGYASSLEEARNIANKDLAAVKFLISYEHYNDDIDRGHFEVSYKSTYCSVVHPVLRYIVVGIPLNQHIEG